MSTTQEPAEHQFLVDMSKHLVEPGIYFLSIPNDWPCILGELCRSCETKRYLLAEEETIHGYTSFFWNKTFLFVKIESWKFSSSVWFKRFRETLQSSAHSDKRSDNIFLWGIKVVRMSWNFVRFHEILKLTKCFLSWQTKKFCSWK